MAEAVPIKIGLTGSIAMGKSTVAKMFAEAGVPVFDADQAVHQLYAKGGKAVAPIKQNFPDAVVDGKVDRSLLSASVLNDPTAIKKLESIVHPLVRLKQEEFLETAQKNTDSAVVLDIPLLFETDRQKEFDIVLVVSAPAEIQEKRALERPGMTREKLENILARQMPDEEKRKRADYVITSDISLEDTRRQVHGFLEKLKTGEMGSTNA